MIEINGQQITRRYDAVIDGVRSEMKCWREWQTWSDEVVKSQFIRDLSNANLKELKDLQWIFKKTDGITQEVLKEKIKKVLTSPDGIEKIIKNIPEDKLIKWFDFSSTKGTLTKNQIEQFIENNFEKIF